MCIALQTLDSPSKSEDLVPKLRACVERHMSNSMAVGCHNSTKAPAWPAKQTIVPFYQRAPCVLRVFFDDVPIRPPPLPQVSCPDLRKLHISGSSTWFKYMPLARTLPILSCLLTCECSVSRRASAFPTTRRSTCAHNACRLALCTASCHGSLGSEYACMPLYSTQMLAGGRRRQSRPVPAAHKSRPQELTKSSNAVAPTCRERTGESLQSRDLSTQCSTLVLVLSLIHI